MTINAATDENPTGYELRENYYALWIAIIKKLRPEHAFARMDNEKEKQQIKGRHGYYSTEDLLNSYLDLCEELGYQPNMYEWMKHTGISMSPIKGKFGKWSIFEKYCGEQALEGDL